MPQKSRNKSHSMILHRRLHAHVCTSVAIKCVRVLVRVWKGEVSANFCLLKSLANTCEFIEFAKGILVMA